jgi:predicted RNA-binding protein with PUA-like domain
MLSPDFHNSPGAGASILFFFRHFGACSTQAPGGGDGRDLIAPRAAAHDPASMGKAASRTRSAPRPAAGTAPARSGAAGAETEGPGHWLVKSEPFKYAWAQLERDGRTVWDGVRNHEARANLAAMRLGELAFFYHSNEGKEIVGVARVARTAYPDPTADDPRWVAVDLEPVCALARAIPLAELRADPAFAELALLRRGRLSVVPVSPAHFASILRLGGTSLPRSGRRPARP